MSELIQKKKKLKNGSAYVKNFSSNSKKFYSLPENSAEYFEKIKRYITSQLKMDLSNYRDKYLNRRLFTRIGKLKEVNSYKEYLDYLLKNPKQESDHFKVMISIHVTEFFRDNKPFRYIEKILLPRIAKGKTSKNKKIRILSAPCSSGEEPYSFAIIVDFLKENKTISNPVEIIGTDLQPEIIQRAKLGIYKIKSLEKISPQSVKKNFTQIEDELMEIKPRIKKYCTFHTDNLLSMTKYKQKFDLIACRNFLIYISKEKQHRVIRQLIENLVPNGYIMFGKSEGMPLLNDKIKVLRGENISEHIYQYKV
ncbi:MAG: CheR family methyltransferase [Promethearchaeota archaeon]